ncbi:MAG: hypothetical protein ACRD9W_17515, partial [Terriglobia bacterium]
KETGHMTAETGVQVENWRLSAFEETPPRRPAPMPMQVLTYWTPGAVFTAFLHGMTEGMGPHRVLRRAAIPVTHNDN